MVFWINLITLLLTSFICVRYYLHTRRLLKAGGSVELCKNEIISDKIYYIFLFAVVSIAIGLRVYDFGGMPEVVWCDEAMAAVDAKALAEYGTDRFGMRYPVHLTAWGYGQMSSLLSYLMVPFIKVFGFSTVVIRLPSLIISLLGLLCLYLFVRSVFNRNVALVVLAFAAINPWHMMQSRWALDCNLYSHFFMIGVYLLYKGVVGKKLWIYASMVIFGLCMYCYGISIYTMPLFLVAACVYLLVTKKIKLRQAGICVLIYLAVAWPFIAVMVVNFFKLETITTPWFTIPFFPDSVRSEDILFFTKDFVPQFFINLYCLFCVVFQITGNSVTWNFVPGFGTMYVCSIPFILLGLHKLWKNKKTNSGIVLCLLFFATGVAAGILTNYVDIWRVNILYYPIMIIIGVALYEVIVHLKKLRWVLLPTYVLIASLFVSAYFSSYRDTLNHYSYTGFSEAVVAAQDDSVDRYYITNYTLSDKITFLWDRSEIMTMYYHKVDSQEYYGIGDCAGSIPGKDKYVYGSFESVQVPSDENAVYIAHEAELKYFNSDDFSFEQFGNFYLITPLR